MRASLKGCECKDPKENGRQAGDLRRHLKMYSGEKSNKCDQVHFASSYKSALIEDTYEKRQRRNFKTNAISVFNDYACSYASQICKLTVQKRGKMQPRWQGIAGFCAPQQIPQSFRRANICKFSQQKVFFFTIAGKQAICGCQKTYTHTHARSLKHLF